MGRSYTYAEDFYCWKVFGTLHQELLKQFHVFFVWGIMGSLGGIFPGFFVGKIIEVMMHCMVWHKEIRTLGGETSKSCWTESKWLLDHLTF